MFVVGLRLVMSGIGMTMVGVFAFVGVPMSSTGMSLASAAVGPTRT